MRKRVLAALSAGAVVLGLVGCASPYEASSNSVVTSDELVERVVTLADGRTITCIVYDGYLGRGGLSCDWETASLDNLGSVE